MAKNFEDILKERGFTEADLSDPTMKTVIERLRPGIEAEISALESTATGYKAQVDTWQRHLDEVVNPRVLAAESEVRQVRMRAAALEEENKLAREWGLVPDEDPAQKAAREAAARAGAGSGGAPMEFDAKKHNVPTMTDIARFADAEGDAMVQLADLQAEYSHLHGGRSIYDYTDSKGNRGLTALRQEAKVAQKPLNEFVAQKFNFDAKRQELSAARQAEHDAKVRQDAISEFIKTNGGGGNPHLANGVPSRASFIPARPAGSGQPWDKTANQLRAERLERAVVSNAQSRAQVN